jgi:hypothetical protein
VARESRPGVRPKKRWRDRLIRWVLKDIQHRAGVFIDESWFVLWPRQAESWARRRRPQRIPKNKSWDRKHRPPSCALYATMDVEGRQVEGEWHETWNQEETWEHLKGVIKRYQERGIRYLVVFWDHAPWHIAQSVKQKVAEHNREARQKGGIRVLLFYLPIRSPWLMPLEPVFGQTKRAVGARKRERMADLQAAVENRLLRRNARVRKHNQQPVAS